MSNDLAWLRKELTKVEVVELDHYHGTKSGKYVSIDTVQGLMDKLPKDPTTLGSAWEVLAVDYAIDSDVLRNMLNQKVYVDTAKCPVIPDFMVNFIEENKAEFPDWNEKSAGEFIVRCSADLVRYGMGSQTYYFDINDAISEWTSENPDAFVKAVMNGYRLK